MDKKLFLSFLDNQKHHALIIGFGIAVIHLLITPALNEGSNYGSFIFVTKFILMAPSFFLFDYLSLPIYELVTPLSNTASEFLFFIPSSLFYGTMGGSLVSKKKFVRLIGILLLGLLIYFGCGLYFMAVFAFG